MPQICYAFTGQASAAPQMGRSLYDKVLGVRNAMDRADKIFAADGFKVTKACFLGTMDELARPSVAGPALFAIHYGIIESLKSRRIQPQFACASGYSLFSMAAALGGLPFEEGIRALRSIALSLETGGVPAVPSLSDMSQGAFQLFSIKSGKRVTIWKELFEELPWAGDAETEFGGAISGMRAMGMDTFIEIGPGELWAPKVRAVDNGIRILASGDTKALSTTLKLAP